MRALPRWIVSILFATSLVAVDAVVLPASPALAQDPTCSIQDDLA